MCNLHYMSFLNANIPPIECYVRGNYLRDQKDSHDKYFPCLIFGVSSLPSQVPLFNFLFCSIENFVTAT